MLYKKNIDFIKKYNKSLYDIIFQETKYPVGLEKVDDQQNYIMELNRARCFIHSIYDTNEEMNMIFNKVESETEAIVLFGLGLGYAIEYIEKNFLKLDRLIIVEPSLDMFKEFLKYNDVYEGFKKIKNLTLIINQDSKLASEIVYKHVLNYKKIDYVFNISYKTLFYEYYNTMITELTKQVRLKKGTIAVTDHSWAYWLLNSARNLKQDNLKVEDIGGLFYNKSVIVVSAGPSLNKNMDLLNKIKDKAIIIAVGTAIKILDSNNIKPHFRAAYDGTPNEKRVFEDLNDSSIPLIYGSKIYFDILPNYEGEKFSMVIEGDVFNRYLYDRKNIKYVPIETGASIANVIAYLMCKLSCSKVIFIGQDLCYTDKKVYASGSGKNANDNLKSDFNEKEYIKTENIYGDIVYTNNVLLNMKYGFEFCVEKNTDVEFINATEGGLDINGTKIKSLEDVIKEDLNDNIDINLNQTLDNINKNEILKETRLKLNFEIDKLYGYVKDIVKINEDRLNLLIELKKNIDKKLNTNRLLKDIDNIQKIEKKLQKIPFYKKVVAIELEEILNTYKLSFAYNGKDVMKQIESVQKILMNICIQVQKFAMYTKELIEEYDKYKMEN